MTQRTSLASPLKTPGGKRWLIPTLERLYAPHRTRRLVEPFCGGMSVALGLRPERALLADANPHLITFWRRLRDPAPFVVEMIHERARYDQARRDFNTMVSTAGQRFDPLVGELFYYLNRSCFNGVIRVNRAGEFNVPFGRYKTVTYRRDFSEYVPVLKAWEIRYLDFRLLKIAPDDFVYLDPPYDAGFTQYTAEGFDWEDQVALAERFAEHTGPVVASNAATDWVLKLYHRLGFHITIIDGPRSVSRNGAGRQPAKEMLATKNLDYLAPGALEGQIAMVEVL